MCAHVCSRHTHVHWMGEGKVKVFLLFLIPHHCFPEVTPEMFCVFMSLSVCLCVCACTDSCVCMGLFLISVAFILTIFCLGLALRKFSEETTYKIFSLSVNMFIGMSITNIWKTEDTLGSPGLLWLWPNAFQFWHLRLKKNILVGKLCLGSVAWWGKGHAVELQRVCARHAFRFD